MGWKRLTATGSTFRENTAAENRNGSAVYLLSGTISRCSFLKTLLRAFLQGRCLSSSVRYAFQIASLQT